MSELKTLRITAVEFENFQCFESPTRIDFAPITLLYGPNSAGKSAVFDALEFIKEFWKQEKRDEQKIQTYFDRWARKDHGSRAKGGRNMRLAIEFHSQPNAFLNARSLFGTPPDHLRLDDGSIPLDDAFMEWVHGAELELTNKPLRLEVELFSMDDELGRLKYLFMSEYHLSFAGSRVISAITGAKSTNCFNFNDMVHTPGKLELVVTIFDNGQPNDLFGIRKIVDDWECETQEIDTGEPVDHSDMFTWKDEDSSFYGWSVDACEVCDDSLPDDHIPPRKKILVSRSNGQKISTQYIYRLGAKADPYSLHVNQNDTSGARIAENINTVFSEIAENLNTIFQEYLPPIVPGDRKIPEKQKLVREVNLLEPLSASNELEEQYFIEALCRGGYAAKLSIEHEMSMATKQPSIFSYGKTIKPQGDWDWDEKIEPRITQSIGSRLNDVNKRLEVEAQFFESVNNTLNTDLFHTLLYQLKIDADVIVGFEELSEQSTYAESEYQNIAKLDPQKNSIGSKARVKLHLLDSNSNDVDFEDVGSGIGYFLPCLVACNLSGLIRIQQPELHLHPALQGNIADVVAGTLSKDSQILCETHSEHLLLRLLKRVRNADHPLAHSDIAVYYFDPIISIEGFETEDYDPSGFYGGKTTTVSRQEITPLGDFLHRWPRGFFEERWNELNDD